MACEQTDAIGADSFFAAHVPELFSGGGLDGYAIDFDFEDVGDDALHVGDEGVDFGLLQTDGAIEIGQTESVFTHEFVCVSQQNLAVDALELWVGIRKLEADVAEVGGAEHCIANDVKQNVGV